MRRWLPSLLFPVLLPAQQEPVSGPAAGVALPPCTVYAPAGPFRGQEFDLAARIGNEPAAILFVHELNRNTAPMIGGLDQLSVEFGWTGLQTYTVRIGGDRNAIEAEVARSSAALQMHRPILVSTDGAEGPGPYALQRAATLTLVLAKDGKVQRSVAFVDTGRADLPKLRALLEEVAGPVPAEPEALRQAIADRMRPDPAFARAQLADLLLALQRERQRAQRRDENRTMQRDAANRRGAEGGARPLAGRAPEDEELKTLLRRVIQRDASRDELDAAFTAIEARAGDDAALRAQVLEMFKLILGLDYGNDEARKRAQQYVDQHGR